MALFGALGGLIGGAKAKKSSKKAAKAQIAGMQQGIGEQQRQLGVTTGMFQPWLQGGTEAAGMYGNLVGTGGWDAQQEAINQLQASPFYQSLYRNGEEALLQNASATGGLRGGNTERSLADFGADTLSTTIDRQLSALGGLSQQGYNAAGALGGFGANTANNVTSLLTGQGQAKADDIMRRAAITANMWQTGGGFLDSAASAIAGGIGAGGGFGAMGAGGAPFDMAAFGNSMFGMPGMFGGGAAPAGGFPGYMMGAPNAGINASTGIGGWGGFAANN
jgi:hypothetical protein